MRIGAGGRYLVTHPFLYPGWEIEWTTPKGVFWLVVVMIVGGLTWIRWPGIEAGLARLLARRRHGNLKAQVEAYRVARWVGQWRWNLWWPLGLAPLWVALGVAAAATTSFLFDLIPVRRR